jgi:alcohol dehydrogenase class IV
MSAAPIPSFAYTAPTIVWFAPNGLGRLGSYLKRLGIERALLVCDERVRESAAKQVEDASGGRVAVVWSGVEADAPRASVEVGALEARSAVADGVIALGGGSSIDSGKAIALLAKHGGDVARWDGANKVGAPGLPVVAIPTTAGTGSEASNVAVLKDAQASRKLVLIDRVIYPAVAILDPRLTVGLPPLLTAATGVDCLTHALEGLVSTYRNPICDAIGLECVRIVRQWLARAVAEPSDLEARGWMLLAASMAGQLVSTTFVGVCHAVAHSLGVAWGVHHGTANGIALPWTIRFNAKNPESAAMYARCAAAFDVDASGDARAAALRFADAIERFISGLGLPTSLSAAGLSAADLPRLAALSFADSAHGPNPVKVESAADLEAALASLIG